MKHYTLFKKILLPLVAIGLIVSALSFFYVFNRNLQAIESKANEETLKLANLLITARSLVGEHVLSSIALLKQYSSAQGTPHIQGTVIVDGHSVPNLMFGATPQTGDNRLVDFVTQIGNGTATIFVKSNDHFIRIATNVKKADGTSAFGTELDPKGKAIASLLKHQAYYGVVDILGEAYLSRYEPMHDRQGKVIGAWYVGYKLDFHALSQAIKEWAFMEHGFVAVTDGKSQIRFLTKHVSILEAEHALKNKSGEWQQIKRPVPEWDFDINILYPKSEAYWASLGALSPWFVIFLLINLTVMIALAFGLQRFVLNPLGSDPETAKQLLMRIESGDFAEDGIYAPANTLIANMVIMRRRLREMVSAMQQNANRLKVSSSVFEHAHDAIFITNANGFIIQSNPSFSVMTGYARHECIGKTPATLGLSCNDPSFFEPFYWSATPKEWVGEMWNRHRQGQDYLVEMELFPVFDENNLFQHYVGLFSDITRAKEQQNMLEHMAYHDALTQLPNRVLFSQRLQQALLDAEREGQSVAICYLDLDDFKIVNDQHGHDYGDKLLQLLSGRIQDMLSEHDTLARLGGDEFALLICGKFSYREYARKLAKLLASIEKPFIIDKLKFSISASIGYTIYPTDHHPPDTLLRHADHAMYHAKTHGGHQCHLFDLASAVQSQQEQIVLRDLLVAIQNNELKLVYQPQVCLKSGEIVSFEALLRWQHPQRGLLNPKDFLALIEHTSLISDIGNWVMEESARQLSSWNQSGLHTQISVNIAAYHLMQKNFATHMAKLFKKYPDIKPQQLQLEITESAAISDFNKVNRVIQTCHNMGVSFSIDDFGAGYSSLIYLRRLPVDIIKIDQSFVHNMLNNEEDMAVIRGVITLCREFNRKVVAEGVEKAEQAAVLKNLGCDFAQGYGISKGLPGHKIQDWIEKHQHFLFET